MTENSLLNTTERSVLLYVIRATLYIVLHVKILWAF